MKIDERRARLALPFTLVRAPDLLRLVGGEAFRYTLRGPGIERWGSTLLGAFEHGAQIGEALATIPAEHRDAARTLVTDLYGERVLVDAPADPLPAPAPPQIVPLGTAAWIEHLAPSRAESTPPAEAPDTLVVLCQDTLDYAAACAFGREQRAAGQAWLWASTGPLARAYVGPVLLPDAGPCMSCIERHFLRLSPVPEIFAALREDKLGPGGMRPTPFPAPGIDILTALVRWKAEALAYAERPRGVFELHVLEAANFEVSTHQPLLDPTCPDCAPW